MMSHCPPHFLEALLELYKRHVAHGQRTAVSCPETMASWVGWLAGNPDWVWTAAAEQKWKHKSNLGDLAWNLFRDLLDPKRGWKEAYYGEAADILKEKIKLLGKYNLIDKTETQVLRGLLEDLRCFANMAESLGGFDMARDGKKCWNILCDTLRPFAVSLMPVFRQQRRHRVHRFVMDNSWDPWALYYRILLKGIDISAIPPYPWTEEGDLWEPGEAGGLVRDEGFEWVPLYSRFFMYFGQKPILIKYDYDGYLE
ncbi:hypothetical protein FLAG1_11823 [Fusarium langsethiae]|uniref:Uncharacterized protein n=1 Tax=Fusarium langsethiae TaxID=179993 RepID=A0A0M9ELF2_FUSLA|nr:hypothetical protein FLAG1_11823 [Fusarium langsethiae]GKU13636.1 unnamed protein product [Fusarium langsethiae]GKU14436.1 unnamed protein product [Fusarium langsethiae]